MSKARTCIICGSEFVVKAPMGRRNKTCSDECREKKNKILHQKYYLLHRNKIIKRSRDRYTPHPKPPVDKEISAKKARARARLWYSKNGKARWHKNKARLNAYHRQWKREYRRKNLEMVRRKDREYARIYSTPERRKRWRANGADRIKKYTKEYRRIHYDKVLERNNLRLKYGTVVVPLVIKKIEAIIHISRRATGSGRSRKIDPEKIPGIIKQIKKGETHVAYAA